MRKLQSYILESFVKDGIINETDKIVFKDYEGEPIDLEVTMKDWVGSVIGSSCHCVGARACTREFPNAKAVAFGKRTGWVLTNDNECLRFHHTGEDIMHGQDTSLKSPVGRRFRMKSYHTFKKLGPKPYNPDSNINKGTHPQRGREGLDVLMRRAYSKGVL